MTKEPLPTRGSLERAIDICLLIDRTPTDRETIAEAYDNTAETVNDDIRTGLRLGLLEESSEGVRATNRGLNVAQASEGSDRRATAIQQIIAKHPIYAEIFTKASPDTDDGQIVATDVDRAIRIRGNDLGKEYRAAAVTTFLKTLEMAGIGEHKQSYKQNPERVEINNEDHLAELRSHIQNERAATNDTEDDVSASLPESDSLDNNTSSEVTGESSDPSPATEASPPDATSTVTPNPPADGKMRSQAQEANFDISLSLDGTEDPQWIERLIAAVQRGLAANPDTSDGDTEPAVSTDEPAADDGTQSPSPAHSQASGSDADPTRAPSHTQMEQNSDQSTDEQEAEPSTDDQTKEPSSEDDADAQPKVDDGSDSGQEELNRFS